MFVMVGNVGDLLGLFFICNADLGLRFILMNGWFLVIVSTYPKMDGELVNINVV